METHNFLSSTSENKANRALCGYIGSDIAVVERRKDDRVEIGERDVDMWLSVCG